MIDPFSQMKREYNTTLGDADSANYITYINSQNSVYSHVYTIPNHKITKKKPTLANNTVNKLKQGEVERTCKIFANPVFINPRGNISLGLLACF